VILPVPLTGGQSEREKDIAAYILETFKYTDHRIIVASVASNIMRIQQIFDAAAQVGRKVVLSGHDLEKNC
jgi:ribonuclease J